MILESNLGQSQLHKMLVQAGDRAKVTKEAAHNSLRNLVYEVWSQAKCESHVDLIKMLGAVDFFLPYFPLEASNLRELFTKRLEDLAQQLHRRELLTLTWPTPVVEFLLSKVDFGDCKPNEPGCYPPEGGKVVQNIITRYVTRALKEWRTQKEQQRQRQRRQSKAADPGWLGSIERRKEALKAKLNMPEHYVQLQIDKSNRALSIVSKQTPADEL